MSETETQGNKAAGASRGGVKATETGAAKQAKGTLAEVESVRQTDPTEAGEQDRRVNTAGVGPDAVVVKADEEVDDAVLSSAGGQEFVSLDKDVVEEFFYPGTTRPAYRILYSKGQTVPRSTIDALNSAAKARREAADRDGVDEANPAGIDPTTLASGTYPGIAPSLDK